jgi:hypothetical protein
MPFTGNNRRRFTCRSFLWFEIAVITLPADFKTVSTVSPTINLEANVISALDIHPPSRHHPTKEPAGTRNVAPSRESRNRKKKCQV